MFESHITVDDVKDKEDFIRICKYLGVKAVLVENDTGSNKVQMMTAKFHRTDDYEQALKEMWEINAALPFKIIRNKLELILGKREAPVNRLYLEYHSKYEMPTNMLEPFTKIVAFMGGHTSTNTLKKPDREDHSFCFMTTRDGKVHDEIKKAVKGFRLVNTIRECVLYDDNPGIDSKWHCMECPIKEQMN